MDQNSLTVNLNKELSMPSIVPFVAQSSPSSHQWQHPVRNKYSALRHTTELEVSSHPVHSSSGLLYTGVFHTMYVLRVETPDLKSLTPRPWSLRGQITGQSIATLMGFIRIPIG